MPVVRRTKFCYENKSSLSCFCFDRYLIAETSQLPRETLRFAKAFRLRQWRAAPVRMRMVRLWEKDKRCVVGGYGRQEPPVGRVWALEACDLRAALVIVSLSVLAD